MSETIYFNNSNTLSVFLLNEYIFFESVLQIAVDDSSFNGNMEIAKSRVGETPKRMAKGRIGNKALIPDDMNKVHFLMKIQCRKGNI